MSFKGKVLGTALLTAVANGVMAEGAQTGEGAANGERDCKTTEIQTGVVKNDGSPVTLQVDPRCLDSEKLYEVRISAPEQCQQMVAKGFVPAIGCNR